MHTVYTMIEKQTNNLRLCRLIMRQSIGDKCLVFSGTCVRHDASVALDDSQSSPLYSFNLVNLGFVKQVVPNSSCIL